MIHLYCFNNGLNLFFNKGPYTFLEWQIKLSLKYHRGGTTLISKRVLIIKNIESYAKVKFFFSRTGHWPISTKMNCLGLFMTTVHWFAEQYLYDNVKYKKRDKDRGWRWWYKNSALVWNIDPLMSNATAFCTRQT